MARFHEVTRHGRAHPADADKSNAHPEPPFFALKREPPKRNRKTMTRSLRDRHAADKKKSPAGQSHIGIVTIKDPYCARIAWVAVWSFN
jgi:hypothetical protein